MSELRCVHCGNPVVEIQYKDAGARTAMRIDTLQNKYKHSYPREYPVCSTNPITDEDVESVESSVED